MRSGADGAHSSVTDIAVPFVLIIAGTWACSWFLSGTWLDRIRRPMPRA